MKFDKLKKVFGKENVIIIRLELSNQIKRRLVTHE